MSSNNINELMELEFDDKQPSLKNENTYRLANIYKVFFARLFDFFVASAPGFALTFVIIPKLGDWGMMMLLICLSFTFIFLYFILLPLALKGNTLGKLVFNIRIVSNEGKIKLKHLLVRETFFMIIPWFITFLAQVIGAVVLQKYANSTGTGENTDIKIVRIVSQLSYLFYAVWMFVLILSIKAQVNHQSFVDMKYNIFVVEHKPKNNSNPNRDKETLKRKDKHISLTDQPGNFNNEVIEEISNDERKEFNQSINVNKKDLIQNLEIETKKKKLIEEKDGEDTNA